MRAWIRWFLSFVLLVVPLVAGTAWAEDEEAPEEGAEEEVVYETPERVTIGVHVNDIQSIDLQTNSYAMDFYVWFRWKNPDLDPSASMEIVNPIELWGMMITPIYEEPEVLDDGTNYQVLRVQGTFSRKLPLYSYPFDRQILTVLLEDAANDTSTLVYVPEGEVPTMNPDLQLPGYRIGAARFATEEYHYPTSFGDPRTEATTTYARARIEVPITRPPVAYATKLFLPVMAVIVCATLMYMLSPTLADARVDVGITSLLTIVALQITYNDALPEVGYLMLMDKVYLLAYAYVLVGLSVVVYTTALAERGQPQQAIVVHRRVLLAVGLAWIVTMGWLVTDALGTG